MATVEEFKVKVNVDGAGKLDQLGTAAQKAGGMINGLSSAILGVGFGAFIHGAMESADRLNDLSDATGLTVGSIKAFGESMRLAGGNSKNAEKSIMALYGAIESAADGSQKSQEAFQAVGVSIKDLQDLSEADILQKTIEGLAKIPAGSERAAAATALLGRSFRSVEAQKFLETLDPAKYAEFEAAAAKSAETVDRLESAFSTLQQGALQAIEPLLGLFDDLNFNAKDAERLFKILGVAIAGVFAAKTLGMIIEIGKAIKIMAGVLRGTVVAQTALVALTGPAGWALIAGGVLAASAAYIALDKAMGDANDTATQTPPAAQPGKILSKDPRSGPAGRKIKDNPEVEAAKKAAAESEKRIAQSQAEFRKLTEMSITDEIKNIRLNAIAEIEKMEIEVRANKLLKEVQKEKEIAERRKEINKKAELDIAKVRMEVEKAMADQLSTINQTTQEKEAQLKLEKESLGLGQGAIDLNKQLLDIELQRKKAIEDAAKVKNADPGDLAKQIELLNQQFESQKAVAEQQYEFQRQFETGWMRAFGAYLDNATNAANQAQQIFSAMTNGMNSAIDTFVDSGKFSFSDFATSIIKDIIKIQLKAQAAQLFTAGAGFLGFKLPGMAAGGPVGAGQPYMIGEKGPELFIPSTAGTIVPNNKLNNGGGGASNTYITNNISAIDSRSVAQLFAENRQVLFGNVEQARRELPLRTR